MRAAAIILFVLSVCAAEVIDIGQIDDTAGIAIRTCHIGDQAMVEVEPEMPGPQRVSGMFLTTNRLLTMKTPVMSMMPQGTNLAKIRTICAGITSEVSIVRFVVRRPVPAPRVGRASDPEAGPRPPIPQGLIPALPATNHFPSYAEFLKRTTEGRRRSE